MGVWTAPDPTKLASLASILGVIFNHSPIFQSRHAPSQHLSHAGLTSSPALGVLGLTLAPGQSFDLLLCQAALVPDIILGKDLLRGGDIVGSLPQEDATFRS